MYNLLPPQQKKMLQKESRYRWAIVVLFALSLVGIVAGISLIPSYILSSVKHRAAAEENKTAEGVLRGQNEASTLAILEATKKKSELLNATLRPVPITTIMNMVLEKKIPGIRIDSFALQVVSKTDATAQISGVATTRNALVDFSKKLHDTSAFDDIDLPVSNLAKSTDIDFSLSFRIVYAQSTDATSESKNSKKE